MEIKNLSTHLKTVAIAESETEINNEQDENNHFSENRRITRSQSVPRALMASPKQYSIKKCIKKNISSEDEIKKIYLNNNVKLIHKNLETIFENPIVKRGNIAFLGLGKQKRSLCLCREFRITTKQKNKLRKSKIKSLGRKMMYIKMSDEEFKQKLSSIDEFINEDGFKEKQETSASLISESEVCDNTDLYDKNNCSMEMDSL